MHIIYITGSYVVVILSVLLSGALSIHFLPMIGHMTTQKLQEIFIIVLAILIDLISAFLISLSLIKIQKGFSGRCF